MIYPKVLKHLIENELKVDVKLEHKFHEERKWRIDIAVFVPGGNKIAIEIEGAVWNNGRHNRASGFLKDLEKYNELSLHGYWLLRYTHSNHQHYQILEDLKRLI